MSNLHSFLQSSKPLPTPVCISQEIRDRGSIFIANIFRATSEDEARKAVAHLRNVLHGQRPASHEMSAWRCMVLKGGKTGLGGPDDFELKYGNEDDGEKYGSGKIGKVMQTEGIIDAVVVVSRWYGGEMLGPVRFAHIETCAREVCHAFRTKDETEECVATLANLDSILASLRAELAQSKGEATTTDKAAAPAKKKQDYKDLVDAQDIPRAKRLITARENAIKSVKSSIQKAKEQKLPSATK
ncbi:ribosomal protein S5 domain 2-like protein [Irpex rosettiformis]|uniref:Ribosomal protein S5 domain 2-like protein n=1 Tax=Irpex rosettiformis TaxID=378272 RepID=A0ACB8U8S4_9APHY|nr:ribosomal protein S5 domain 2-like protein [Irpex rosettiformis]